MATEETTPAKRIKPHHLVLGLGLSVAAFAVTSGIVPMAPGVNEPADYGVLITVPCVTGRYLKLKAADIWNRNAYTGLSEIQVLGF